MKRPFIAVEIFLWPLALLYRAIMNLRNIGYDRYWLLSRGVTAPVLSIGNLTAGGTGKTPLTACLVEGFRARGQKVGIISRGYGGSRSRAKEPTRVPSTGGRRRANLATSRLGWRRCFRRFRFMFPLIA